MTPSNASVQHDGDGDRAQQEAPPLDSAIQDDREHPTHRGDDPEHHRALLGPRPPRVVPVAVPGRPHLFKSLDPTTQERQVPGPLRKESLALNMKVEYVLNVCDGMVVHKMPMKRLCAVPKFC